MTDMTEEFDMAEDEFDEMLDQYEGIMYETKSLIKSLIKHGSTRANREVIGMLTDELRCTEEGD